MTREIAAVIAGLRDSSAGPVFVLEEDAIWFSGMNANLGLLMRKASRQLEALDYDVGEPVDDGISVVNFGGMRLPVDGCDPIPKSAHEEAMADA